MSLPLFALPALGQELPPPETPKKKEPDKKKGPAKPGTGGTTTAAPAPSPVLLLQNDMPCTVSIDGERVAKLTAPRSMQRVTTSQGQHVMTAVSDDGKLKWEQVVDVKGGGQQVVTINLAAAGASSLPADFDRAAATAWLAISDFKVIGRYADGILNKSWGFHNKELSRVVFAAHEHLKHQMDNLKRFTPSDSLRKRAVDDFGRSAAVIDKYVDTVTKAIASAQQANSWLGEPLNQFQQAQATQDNLNLPADTLATLKGSSAFVEAVPSDQRARLGLQHDSRDASLGAEYAQSSPLLLLFVDKGGLADEMGFRPGDRLVSAGGKTLASMPDFKSVLRENLGRRLKVTYEHDGKRSDKEVKVPAQLR